MYECIVDSRIIYIQLVKIISTYVYDAQHLFINNISELLKTYAIIVVIIFYTYSLLLKY